MTSAELARRALLVSGLVWRSAPLTALGMLVLTVASGVAPTVSAWLNREVLDALVPGQASPVGGHGADSGEGPHVTPGAHGAVGSAGGGLGVHVA
ncbi:MAG TPA: hypothetical protein VGS19_28430, partial [Streptosporangiaceae bacterium]|nr:hypothetical protein [Streptosporangiaceae bacterium]